jgi:LEA14-like dessication related protein
MRILILLGLVVLLSSCALFKAPEFERLNEVQLRDLTADHTKLNLSVVISNPNWYAITVKKLDIEVFNKNREKLSDIVMTQPLKIEKHAADTVYFEIQLDTRKVAKILSYSAQKVEFIIKARAHARVFGISKLVRIEQTEEVNFTKILEDLLPSIPAEIELPLIQAKAKKNGGKDSKLLIRDPDIKPAGSSPLKPDLFKVVKTSVTDIGLKESELTIKFQLLNPYGLAFTLLDFPAEIWINNKKTGRGKLAKPVVFNEITVSSEGEMVFTLNNVNSVLLASGALMNKDMNYRVEGTLMVEGFGTSISKPFRFKGTVEIGKKDKERNK